MKRMIWLGALGVVLWVIPQLSYSRIPSESKIWVMKADSLGNTIWTRSYKGEPALGFGQNCVQQTSDGGLIITGNVILPTEHSRSLYLLKLNSEGDSVWSRTYKSADGGIGHAVLETPDRGYLVLAELIIDSRLESNFLVVSNNDLWIIKTDSLGDTLWTHTYGGESRDEGNSLHQTSDGGYIITGYTTALDESKFVWLLKLDSLGDTLWTRTYEGYESNSAYETTDGEFIIVARRDSKPLLMKVDSSGDLLWENLGEKYAVIIIADTRDGGYIIAEYIEDRFRLIRMNGNGEILWEHSYDQWTIGFWIEQASDDGYVVTGLKAKKETRDAWLLKTDSDGNILWERTYFPGAKGCGKWVGQAPDGGYIVVGYETILERKNE